MLAEETAGGFPANRDLVWSTTMALWAEVSARTGDRAAATVLAERLAPFSGHLLFTGNVAFGTVAHALGELAAVLGRHDEAVTYFTEALAIEERLSAPFQSARTKVAWAKVAQTMGNSEQARLLLTGALTLSREFGCRAIEREAGALLEAAVP